MDYYFLLKHYNPFNILCAVPAFNIYSLGTATGNKLTSSQWIPIKSAKIRGKLFSFYFCQLLSIEASVPFTFVISHTHFYLEFHFATYNLL